MPWKASFAEEISLCFSIPTRHPFHGPIADEKNARVIENVENMFTSSVLMYGTNNVPFPVVDKLNIVVESVEQSITNIIVDLDILLDDEMKLSKDFT